MNELAKTGDQMPVTTAITPMEMLQVAVERGADIDQLTKLMDLQERWEKNEARKAYVTAMAGFQEKCPTIDKTLKAHNSTYAGLAETLEQIRELLSESGLSHSWVTDQSEAAISVTCCVTHINGHKECTTMTAPADTTGSKNSIQAIGSTVKYLQRYTLFSILGLASKEHDDDGNQAGQGETITEEQESIISAKISEVGADRDAFLEYLGVDTLMDLEANKFGGALKALAAKQRSAQ